MFDTQVMQATSNHHDQIRKISFRISQNIFDDPRALDTSNRMFHFDANFRYLAIALFFFAGQLFLARLFFG